MTFLNTVIPSGANRSRSERCGVEGPAVGLRKSWRMREESWWRKQKAGPSTRELIGKADQFI
jgi:hypothetical protein